MPTRRRIFLAILLVFLSIAHNEPTGAAQIWTDGDGDGLPDIGPISVKPNASITVGVWIDAESFGWTNYLAYVGWTPSCIEYDGATYVISGGSNFPIDDFSHPSGIGFGGSGYDQGGIDHIGNISFTVLAPVACCVTPIINPNNPYYVFSQLGAGTAYTLFSTSTPTCYGEGPLPGACCFVDGSCSMQTPQACAAGGGAYQGDAALCADADCLQPDEACCLPDGSCQDVTPEVCVSLGGSSQGAGTTCAAIACPQPPVACCLPDNTCQDLDRASCLASGGAPQDAGTMCATTVCPQACCFITGQCFDLTVAACEGSGGVPQGPGSSCVATVCVQTTEACCNQSGLCVDRLPAECVALGGISRGPGTSCAANDCFQACCFGDQTCREIDATWCLLQDGVPQGIGTTCATTQCPPFEACCTAWGVCTDTDPDYCVAGGNTPQGPGSACSTSTCPVEACCLGWTTCFDVDPATCLAWGGTPMGAGTTCARARCPTEACCLPRGGCEDADPDYCSQELYGYPLGPGSACSTSTCLPLEACCFPWGYCDVVYPDYCTALEGTLFGPGSPCSTSTCSREACCMPDGYCYGFDHNYCLAQGGTPLGPGSTCRDACPGSEACCSGDECWNIVPALCDTLGGTPLGPGTWCEDRACPVKGACCLLSGACEYVRPENCASKGGRFIALGVPCDSLTCQRPPWIGEESGAKPATSLDSRRLGTSRMLAVYPNPTTGNTSLIFRVPAAEADVDLSVYDVAGRRVASIAQGPFAQGEWSMTWDGRSRITGDLLPPGIYFVRLDHRGESHTEKLIVVR